MLAIKDLQFAYTKGILVLDNLNLTVADQENVALFGDTGSGKSTLLGLLTGLLTPAQGSIFIDKTKIERKNIAQVRQQVGLVFQNPENQLFMPTIYEDLAFGLRNNGVDANEIARRVSELAQEMGIAKLLSKNSFELSGGEQRMAALACVLIMQPKILLLDEPTAFLDLKSRKILQDYLKKISVTKIIVTHDLDFAVQLCPRAICLAAGKIIEDAASAKIAEQLKISNT